MAEQVGHSDQFAWDGIDPGSPFYPLPGTVSVPTPPSLPDRQPVAHQDMPVEGTQDLPPPSLGKYQLLQQVAVGGMGVVYKARDQVLNRVVALKTIRSGVLAQPVEVKRFYLEARAAAHLRHPNIISIFDIDQQGGQHYFTMGFAAGGTLAKHQERYHADPRGAVVLMAKISICLGFPGTGIVWLSRLLPKGLSPAMQKVFGSFRGHVSIQRSPPRWVEDQFVDKALEFLKELE